MPRRGAPVLTALLSFLGHDVGYSSELAPHISSEHSRITLVRSYTFHPELSNLGLPVEDLPAVS